MAYTPEFDMREAVAVRRLAWAMGTNMKQAVRRVVDMLPLMFGKTDICPQCRDTTKCYACVFSRAGLEGIREFSDLV
jgi:hypothetical protein